MIDIKKSIRGWEISFLEIQTIFGKRYKVTRRLPSFSIAETKIFRSRKRAEQQLNVWLNQ